MNQERVDKIIQYSLLLASKEDEFSARKLGPIHLLKYVYLADLAYAESHQGETFTCASWQFYHYGPWCLDVFERIGPAVQWINAEEQTWRSTQYDKDVWRWWLPNDEETDSLREQTERDLPSVITSVLKKAVHKFCNHTGDLLHAVYVTRPMLQAAPGEFLSFEPVSTENQAEAPSPAQPEKTPLSARQQKLRTARIDDFRKKMRDRAGHSHSEEMVPPPNPPRYDDDFIAFQQWLDGEPGEQILGIKEAVFSDSIWKSPNRGDKDVP